MLKLKATLITLAGGALLTFTAVGQSTNYFPVPPATKLESLETNIGTVIIKCFARIGAVAVDAAEVSITCKENINTGTGEKEFGLVLSIEMNNQLEDRTTIDYDELNSLLGAFEYLNKIDWSALPLTSFDAVYTSKSGLRFAAFSSRREGTIGFRMRTPQMEKGLLLTRDQLAQLRGLIDQGRRKLDALRANQ